MIIGKYVYFAHFGACVALAGVIWLVQLVHYPAFRFIHPEHFGVFHRFHSVQITYLVAPLMAIELITAIALLVMAPQQGISYFNFASVLALWLVTFFVSVPLHRTLAHSYSLDVINKLIVTNWWRTALWSVRVVALMVGCAGRL